MEEVDLSFLFIVCAILQQDQEKRERPRLRHCTPQYGCDRNLDEIMVQGPTYMHVFDVHVMIGASVDDAVACWGHRNL